MAYSVASERAFSSAGITISKRRNRLDSDIVEALQCLKSLLQQNLMSTVFPTVALGVADEEMMLDIADKQPTNQEGSTSEAIKAVEDWTLEAVVEDANEDAFADDVEVFE